MLIYPLLISESTKDLVTHKALRPDLRPSTEREAVYVA
jgi:hypothetical protein